MLDLLVKVRITSATCSTFTIGATIYRLYLRRSRYWFDDAFACFSCLVLVMQLCCVFIRVPDPYEFTHLTRVALYYVQASAFLTIIWSARLSILYSIIRLDPCPSRRTRLHCTAVLFALFWALLMGQQFWVCQPEPGWRNELVPQCRFNEQIALSQLISDVIADSILLFAPWTLWWGLSDLALRRRLLIIFSSCVITTIVSIVHAAIIIFYGDERVVIAGLVENCVSLIVCNFPVLVAKFFLKQDNAQEASFNPTGSVFASGSTKNSTKNMPSSSNARSVEVSPGVLSPRPRANTRRDLSFEFVDMTNDSFDFPRKPTLHIP